MRHFRSCAVFVLIAFTNDTANKSQQNQKRRIVSSRRLADGENREALEFEYGLIIANNAFNRWMQRCMMAVGGAELSTLEILVLHHTNHRDREKRMSDIAFLKNIEGSHTVTYALRKLVKLKLIEA
jgi:predicted MarR family transcription regulator